MLKKRWLMLEAALAAMMRSPASSPLRLRRQGAAGYLSGGSFLSRIYPLASYSRSAA